jgi:hypothetical protein
MIGAALVSIMPGELAQSMTMQEVLYIVASLTRNGKESNWSQKVTKKTKDRPMRHIEKLID